MTNNYVSEIEVSYSPKIEIDQRVKVKIAIDAVQVLRNIWSKDMELRESFYILLMNNSGHVIGWYALGKGGVTGVVVDMRIMFATAIKALASKMILAHNHPSGVLRPSEADKALTKTAIAAGLLLDIKVIDHIILTHESFYSFEQNGEL